MAQRLNAGNQSVGRNRRRRARRDSGSLHDGLANPGNVQVVRFSDLERWSSEIKDRAFREGYTAALEDVRAWTNDRADWRNSPYTPDYEIPF